MPRPKKLKNVTAPLVSVQVDFGRGEVYNGGGASVLDAILTLKLPSKVVRSALLTITKGEKKFVKHFPLILLRKIFTGKIFQVMWSNKIEYLFKN